MTASPRSSVDAVHGPSSPFLHNLHQRLRKGSSASRASSQSSETVQTNKEAALEAQDGQSAKRYLVSILRDDWDYPPDQNQKVSSKQQREAVGHRLRDESVSEYESSVPRNSRNRDEDAYKFDNPDDVGALFQRKRARKRRLLEQEMTWNDGLKTWTLRRDAWTGAVPHKPTPTSAQPSKGPKRASNDSKSSKKSSSTRRSSSSAPSWPLPDPSQNGIERDGTPTQIQPDSSTAGATIPQSFDDTQQDDSLPDGPYLPIYPPLLPESHNLRSRIKPSAYPTLYSKVVVQGLSPNVPIPLNHMINALVEGWKAEGQWPPTPLDPQQRLANRRKASKKTESAFQRWKREQDEKRKSKEATERAQDFVDPDRQKGLRGSISGAVKKVMGKKEEAVDVEGDLQKMGLTFTSEAEADPDALENGHV